jgi:HNH endonuclease
VKIPTFSKAQIIAAMQKAAARLGHAPSQAELLRIAGITPAKVMTHFRTFREAVRAAGLEPQKHGRRVDAWALLSDWGRVTRGLGRPPSFQEYGRKGRHGSATLERRFGGWNKVRERFTELVLEHGRMEEWSDVVEMIRRSPVPTRATANLWQRMLKEERMAERTREQEKAAAWGGVALTDGTGASTRVAAPPAVLPPPLQGKKRVTSKMLTILFAIAARTNAPGRDLARCVAIQPFPDRPVMGAPIRPQPRNTGAFGDPGFMLEALACEPVNEMGVMFVFALLARRMGFVIEVLRSQFPDCEARFEVEPGRWQRVRIEFEFESIGFRNHRHDPDGCDIIVCWRHNWAGCPKKLVVIELSKIV